MPTSTSEKFCVFCGVEVMEDPTGSPGVLVHKAEDGGVDYDQDRHHVAVLDMDPPQCPHEDGPSVGGICGGCGAEI